MLCEMKINWDQRLIDSSISGQMETPAATSDSSNILPNAAIISGVTTSMDNGGRMFRNMNSPITGALQSMELSQWSPELGGHLA